MYFGRRWSRQLVVATLEIGHARSYFGARVGERVTFEFGVWAADVGVKRDVKALRGFDYVSIAPSEIDDLMFVPGREGAIRTLTLRDDQHTYVYGEEGRNGARE